MIISIILLLNGCGLQATGFETYNSQRAPGADKVITDGELKVIFLNIGQGNSQLIITKNGKNMLIDGGDNGKEEQLFEYLKEYNVKKIDVLIASHGHSDHIGTLPETIDKFEIGSIYMPKATNNTKTFEALLVSIKNKGLKVNTAKIGVTIPLDEGVLVDLLGPVNTYDNLNDTSAVVKVSYGESSFLFPGDAEHNSEQDMLKSNIDLSADVLAVSHHGSNTSSSMELLKKVKPQYGIIQVGEENRYGHPTDNTLKRLKDMNIKTLRTDLNGTITFITDGKTIEVSTTK